MNGSALRLPPPPAQTEMASQYNYNLSPSSQFNSPDRRMSNSNEGGTASTTITIRKLPRSTTPEAVRTMLIFSKDLREVELVPNEFEEDHGFLTALARFSTANAATEAQALLDGKPNTAGEAKMIVEVQGGPYTNGRRNTRDPSHPRGVPPSTSPPMLNPQAVQKSSRFNGTFQSLEKLSPPGAGSSGTGETPSSEASSHLQTIFSPQSPVGKTTLQDYSRITGKSVISQDSADDDTGELLKDPVAYMKNDSATTPGLPRRPTNPQMPLSRFSTLSLNTNMTGSALPGYASPRSAIPGHTPVSAMSPNMGPVNGYPMPNAHYLRHNYPPVNPADQNPPCNTLYVGNLPIDTSEDELKAMFSKQRGYKRLCFRTKQNGPMCFVEFEDISFATKALNELYGVQLHNSVKGGIRLSFSKNPLGVRAGQPGSTHPSTPLTPVNPMSGIGNLAAMSPAGFSAANGPPPGLSLPPGLGMSMSSSNGGSQHHMPPLMMNNGYSPPGLGIGVHGVQHMRHVPLSNGMSMSNGGPPINGHYPDYMLGR